MGEDDSGLSQLAGLGFEVSNPGRLLLGTNPAEGVMNHEVKCQLAVCHCKAQAGRLYCSDDCEQAASQGVEREFCQCAHDGCKSDTANVLPVDPAGIRESFRFFSSGQITIEYENLDDLTHQVLALAAALSSEEKKDSPATGNRTLERRAVTSESGRLFTQSQPA